MGKFEHYICNLQFRQVSDRNEIRNSKIISDQIGCWISFNFSGWIGFQIRIFSIISDRIGFRINFFFQNHRIGSEFGSLIFSNLSDRIGFRICKFSKFSDRIGFRISFFFKIIGLDWCADLHFFQNNRIGSEFGF